MSTAEDWERIAPAPTGPQPRLRPVCSVTDYQDHQRELDEFVERCLTLDQDYGSIAGGAQRRRVLFQPGAQHLARWYGLSIAPTLAASEEDWTGADHGGEPFFMYRYRCDLIDGDNRIVGGLERLASSWEIKYRYRWITTHARKSVPDGAEVRNADVTEADWKIDQGKTSGPYGKPAEYWEMFRKARQDGSARLRQVENARSRKGHDTLVTVQGWEYKELAPDPCEQANTINAMAQKRSVIAAVVQTLALSEHFSIPPDGGPPKKASKPNSSSGPKAVSEESPGARVALSTAQTEEVWQRALEAVVNPPVAAISELPSVFPSRFVFTDAMELFATLFKAFQAAGNLEPWESILEGEYGVKLPNLLGSQARFASCYEKLRRRIEAPAEDGLGVSQADIEGEEVSDEDIPF